MILANAKVTGWFKRNRKASKDSGCRISVGRCYSGADRNTPLTDIELILFRDDSRWMQIAMAPSDAEAIGNQMVEWAKGKNR